MLPTCHSSGAHVHNGGTGTYQLTCFGKKTSPSQLTRVDNFVWEETSATAPLARSTWAAAAASSLCTFFAISYWERAAFCSGHGIKLCFGLHRFCADITPLFTGWPRLYDFSAISQLRLSAAFRRQLAVCSWVPRCAFHSRLVLLVRQLVLESLAFTSRGFQDLQCVTGFTLSPSFTRNSRMRPALCWIHGIRRLLLALNDFRTFT